MMRDMTPSDWSERLKGDWHWGRLLVGHFHAGCAKHDGAPTRFITPHARHYLCTFPLFCTHLSAFDVLSFPASALELNQAKKLGLITLEYF